MGIYKTRPKLIKARQLEKVEQVYDIKTGERFIGQIGDWVVYDEDGYLSIVNYYQFISRYSPNNEDALEQYGKKEKIFAKRGQLLKNIISKYGE